jgi:hypothetical protein
VGSITAIAAESAGDLKLPGSYRHWYHVNTMVIDKGSPLFEAMGGMHNVYINSIGESALKKGEPYPDKTTSPSPMAPSWKVRGRRLPSC